MTNRNGEFSRRKFLRNSGMFAGAIALGQSKSRPRKSPTRPLLELAKLERYVDPLPIPPLVRPRDTRANPENPGAAIPYYRIAMKPGAAKIHRDLRPTQFWGYNG